MLFGTYETSSMTINGEEFMCTNQEVHLEMSLAHVKMPQKML